jgi:8-oxo-dGTP diphosphatase
MRATAVIIKDGLILLIHRFRDGEEFFVLPGGGVEEGESMEETTVREVKEETNLDAKIDKKMWEYYNDYDKRIHHFFLVTNFSGNLELGGNEAKENSTLNSFVLEWHKLKDISNLPIKPDFVKEKILENIDLLTI